MATIAELMIKLGVDDKGLDKGLQGVGAKMDRLGGSLASKGKMMSRNVSLPLAAAGVAAFKMASDVDESMSQVGQVFGEEADNIIKASENVNDAFSQADFLAIAGNIGDITQGIGIAKEESDDWATEIVSLGQDLGSFKNEDPTRVIQAITSALTGEREQLKSLGIVINEAMVKTKAMEMGLADANGEVDQAAKAQATMALITEKSANSIGDFDRTSDGAANKTRILASNFKDTAASLGKELLPMGTQLLTMVNNWVKQFQNLSPEARKWIVRIGGIVAAIGPVLFVGGKLISTFSKVGKAFTVLSKLVMANPWVALIAGTIALVTLIIMNWDKITAFLKAAWDFIMDKTEAVRQWLVDKFGAAVEFIKNLFLNFTPLGLIIKHFDKIKSLATGVWRWLKEKFGAAVDFIVKIFKNFTPLGFIISRFDKIKALATGVKDWISDRIDDIVGFFTDLPGRIRRAVSGMWDGLKSAFRSAINWIIDKWNNFKITIGGFKLPAWLGGGTAPSFTFNTPNIPRLHDGGVFRAPPGQREGLALLEDGERVSRADQAPVQNFYLNNPVDHFATADAISWRMRFQGV